MAPPRRRLHRYEGLNHARYLTCSCYRRLALFGNHQIKDAFAEHLRFVQRELAFELFAWVVMPEHIHLLLRPAAPPKLHTAPCGMLCGTPRRSGHSGTAAQSAQTVTQILRRLKSPFGRLVVTRWRQLGAPVLKHVADHRDLPRFWQPGGGYDRNVYADAEFLEKIEYIHDNPVRRGLVEYSTAYRWSSARFYLGEPYDGPAITRMA